MRFINSFKDNDNISGIYLCKQKTAAVTKNGKEYENLVLADKTGTVVSKIWDPGSMGIGDFEVNDFIEINGKVSIFNGALQLSISRAFKAKEGSYDPRDYIPVSRYNIDDMWKKLSALIDAVEAPYYNALLKSFFEDEAFAKLFKDHSAAKTVHHGFMGGLLQHTLTVATICSFLARLYKVINKDLLITAALLHDIGKVRELSDFPLNDYTDEGQLLGHIMIGAGMISDKAREIPDFPEKKKTELLHCILSHHGALEYGSPKLPSLIEAVALSYADNIDAKIEVFSEALDAGTCSADGWLGFNKFLDTNIRKTT